jgi:hypothetical protein
MNQNYKWVCKLTVLVWPEGKRKVEEVNFSITKVLPFTPNRGLGVEFLGMPIYTTPVLVCYIEDGDYFEVFMYIGSRKHNEYCTDRDVEKLESHGWTRGE